MTVHPPIFTSSYKNDKIALFVLTQYVPMHTHIFFYISVKKTSLHYLTICFTYLSQCTLSIDLTCKLIYLTKDIYILVVKITLHTRNMSVHANILLFHI